MCPTDPFPTEPFPAEPTLNDRPPGARRAEPPTRRRVIPLPPGRAAALPLSSRSPATWATALADLGDPRHALVEVNASGEIRWWSPQRPGSAADGHAADTPEPLELVWCRRAAPDVEMVALVVGAVGATGPAVADDDGAPISAVVAATRCGEHAVTVGSWRHGTATVAGRGAAVDAVLLYLGLSTPAEARTPADLVTSMWADRLLAAAALQPGSVTTWAGAARHHPLTATGATSPQLSAAARDLGRLGWDRIRLAVGGGRAEWANLSPAVARWMDRGAFARWLLDRYPDLGDQRLALRAVLPTTLAATVARTIEESLD